MGDGSSNRAPIGQAVTAGRPELRVQVLWRAILFAAYNQGAIILMLRSLTFTMVGLLRNYMVLQSLVLQPWFPQNLRPRRQIGEYKGGSTRCSEALSHGQEFSTDRSLQSLSHKRRLTVLPAQV